jgi:hypothetical protein
MRRQAPLTNNLMEYCPFGLYLGPFGPGKKEKRKQNNDKHVKNINPEDITPHHTKNCLVYLGGRSFPIKNARLARDGRGLTIPVGLLPLLPRPHLFFLFCLSLPSPLPLPLLPTPWPVFSNKTTTTTMSVRPTTTMNTKHQTPNTTIIPPLQNHTVLGCSPWLRPSPLAPPA